MRLERMVHCEQYREGDLASMEAARSLGTMDVSVVYPNRTVRAESKMSSARYA